MHQVLIISYTISRIQIFDTWKDNIYECCERHFIFLFLSAKITMYFHCMQVHGHTIKTPHGHLSIDIQA